MGSRNEDGSKIVQNSVSLRKLGKSTSITVDGQETTIFNNSPTEIPDMEAVDELQKTTFTHSTIVKTTRSTDDSEQSAFFKNEPPSE